MRQVPQKVISNKNFATYNNKVVTKFYFDGSTDDDEYDNSLLTSLPIAVNVTNVGSITIIIPVVRQNVSLLSTN